LSDHDASPPATGDMSSTSTVNLDSVNDTQALDKKRVAVKVPAALKPCSPALGAAQLLDSLPDMLAVSRTALCALLVGEPAVGDSGHSCLLVFEAPPGAG
jgi:hypothetical protein